MTKSKHTVATGRRKTAVASVRLKEGTGKFDVNGKDFQEYFSSEAAQKIILAPLDQTDMHQKYDMIIRIKGGGPSAQAIAVRLGLSRALVQDHEHLHKLFKELGFLTRDPRKKERKKYGLAGARKQFQFSKR